MTEQPKRRGGRPVTTGPTKVRTLRSGDVWDVAEAKAKRLGTTMTTVVNQQLEQFAANNTTLAITIGLPGCGKTSRALHWVQEAPAGRVRVGRDTIRRSLHGAYLKTPEQERLTTISQHAQVDAFLRAGIDVVVDDTNLDPAHVKQLTNIAAQCGADVEIWDMRDVDPDLCRARNQARTGEDRVPDEAFDHMLTLLHQ